MPPSAAPSTCRVGASAVADSATRWVLKPQIRVAAVPVDARRTPGWILRLQGSNQALNLQADARPTEAVRPRPPSPEQTKSSTVPGHDGIRPYDDQGIHPPRPQTAT